MAEPDSPIVSDLLTIIDDVVDINEDDAPYKSADGAEPDRLLSELGVSSLLLFRLIRQLEVHYSIEFADSDLTPDNFRTVKSTAALLERYAQS
jgi:acyl carrier protein